MSMAGGAADMATEETSTLGLSGKQTSTNKRGVPVPWWSGLSWRALTWIVPDVMNKAGVPGERNKTDIKVDGGTFSSDKKVGAKFAASVAGIAGLGLADSIHAIEINNKIVWPTTGEPDPAGRLRIDTGDKSRDNPASPYWRTAFPMVSDGISSTFYVYWGRDDQPADNTVLAKWKAAGSVHPNYRGQILVCIENYYFGRNITSVPNTRLLLRRTPRPRQIADGVMTALGNFPTLGSAQGESMPAAILELLTHPVFGAGIPGARFSAAQWQAISTAVADSIGCHSPELTRATPVREAVKELLSYYDGTLSLRNGQLIPDRNPHSAAKTAPRANLKLPDYAAAPSITTTPPAQAANAVRVNYRDKDQLLSDASVAAYDSACLAARAAGEEKALDMPAIIDPVQASGYAARAAATASSAQTEISLTLRPPRAVKTDGTRLLPGDAADFSYDPLGIAEKYCRITSRTDAWRGKTTLTLASEHGFFAPLPDISAQDPYQRPGNQIPSPVAKSRILELPRVNFTRNSPARISFLIRRPTSHAQNNAAYIGDSVAGCRIEHAPDGATSFDLLGDLAAWACSGKLSAPLTAATATATVVFDAANLDLNLFTPQSPAQQSNNTVLLVIENEILAIGDFSKDADGDGLTWDIPILRGRLDTKPAPHAANRDAWLCFAEDLVPLSHADWLPASRRRFKLLPHTSLSTLPAEQADEYLFTFAPLPADNPAPEITFDTFLSTIPAGTPFSVSGQITAEASDIAQVRISLVAIMANGADGPSQIFENTQANGDSRALFPFNLLFVCPDIGTYAIDVRVTNDAGQIFAERSNLITSTPPEPSYGGGDFTPSITTAETLVYGNRIGRWDSRSGWCRLWLQITGNGSSGTDNHVLTIDLTAAGIPESAWPPLRGDLFISGQLTYNDVVSLAPITKGGAWGITRAEYLTSSNSDNVMAILIHASNGLFAVCFRAEGAVVRGIRNSEFGNNADNPSLLDMTWMLPDPFPAAAQPMPYAAPSPPNLAFANFKAPGNVGQTISRSFTIKVPHGTLAGCKITITNYCDYCTSNNTTLVNKLFTEADGDSAVVTMSKLVSGGSPGSAYKYWWKMTLTSASGLSISYTGPKVIYTCQNYTN
jgi:hypothetical protein